MSLAIVHSTVATLPDEDSAEVNKDEWNANHTFSGMTANAILYASSATALAQASGFTWGPTAGQGLTIAAGTATTDVNALNLSQTWNNASVAFNGFKFTVTDSASAAGSLHSRWLGGAAGTTDLLGLSNSGNLIIGGSSSYEIRAQLFAGNPSIAFGKSSTIAGLMVAELQVSVGSNRALGFAVNTNPLSGVDTALSKISTGLMGVGIGTVGSYSGGLKLTNLIIAGVAFANLPASPVAGQEATVTDSNTATWGATIAGGGANNVKARYNGSNWTVVGI